MGRVLVKSALPGKVLVKSNYAFDAFGNPVMLSTPSTKEGAPVRGERLSGILGGAVGAGLSLTQPTNNFGQFINNLRYGMFEGARDARRLRRGLAGRREKIRANRGADIADKYAGYRSQENPAEAKKRGKFDRLTGGNFRTTANQEKELYGANVQRKLADERAANAAKLGEEIYRRQAQISGTDPGSVTHEEAQEFMRNRDALIGRIPQVANRNRIDALPPAPALPPVRPNEVALPGPTQGERDNLLTQIQTATTPKPVGPAIDKPMEGTESKPSGTVKVVDAGGNIQGNVGTQESMTRLSAIQPPSANMGASNADETEIPSTTMVNPAMDRFNQMKPEPAEEEEVDMSGSANSNDKLMNGIMAKITSQRQGAGP